MEQFVRYSCRVVGARNYTENVNAPENFVIVAVKPGAAYCPVCGFALADFWHEREPSGSLKASGKEGLTDE